MGVASTDTNSVVTTAVQEINHIATLPEITLRIIELVESPTSTAQDLQSVIRSDPALCSRVLKVVNSAFYGLPGQIASIERAIVLLGLNAVKNIAVAASLVKLFRGGELSPHFSARDLWTHSVATATAAKSLADELGLGMADEAFLGGLIHDLGVMVELQYDRQKLIKVLDSLNIDSDHVPHADMRRIETDVFGATHEEFGSGLSKRWKFPASLINVTGHHHDPMRLPEEARTLSCVIYVADRVSAMAGQGFRLDLDNLTPDPAVLAHLGIQPSKLDEMASALTEQMQEVKRLLS
ncbi:MAG: HDOD domain-containing protein [Phycisphaerales bacterium]